MGKRDLPGEIPSGRIIDVLQRHGWKLYATVGDHHQYKMPDGGRKVTVSHPSHLGTRRRSRVFESILRQMGVSRKEFAAWYYED